jgi:hypothetical protein
MGRYDDYDEHIEQGVINDEEADDFANFDPKRYLNKRTSRPLVGDERDEVELGVGRSRRGQGRSGGRGASQAGRDRDRDDDGRGRSNRGRYADDDGRGRGGSSRSRRRTPQRERRGCLDLITGVLFTTAEFGSTARALLLGIGCLIFILAVAVCGGGAWLIYSGLTPR